MRARYLGVLASVLWGCSGSHVVAGPDKTEAQKLEDAAPAWCANICPRLRSCEEVPGQGTDCECDGDVCNCSGGNGIDDKCEAQCEDLMVGALTSDVCAGVVSRLQRCYDTQGCTIFESNPSPCRDLENQAQNCYDTGDVGDPPPIGGPNTGDGDADDPSAPYGDDPYPVPGYGPTATVVSCLESSAAGQADPPAPGTTDLICEEGRADCSDGHEYTMTCLETYSGQRACVCVFDGVVLGAFAPGPSCPTIDEMNAGCGWRLSEN